MLGCLGRRSNAVYAVVTTGRLDAIRSSDGRQDCRLTAADHSRLRFAKTPDVVVSFPVTILMRTW
jgi:hypothetical protein